MDNGGGGIFSFLTQARTLNATVFESLFATPRHHDLEAVVRAFGHAAVSVSTRAALREAIDDALARDGVSVVIARVPDRATNVAVHDQYVTAVAGLWRSSTS